MAVCPFWKVRFGLCSQGGGEMLQIPVLKTVCPLAGFDMCVSTERLVGNTSLCIPTKVKRYFHGIAQWVHNLSTRRGNRDVQKALCLLPKVWAWEGGA